MLALWIASRAAPVTSFVVALPSGSKVRGALAVTPLADPWALRRLVLCVRRLDALPVHARRLVEHLIAGDPAEPPAPGA